MNSVFQYFQKVIKRRTPEMPTALVEARDRGYQDWWDKKTVNPYAEDTPIGRAWQKGQDEAEDFDKRIW